MAKSSNLMTEGDYRKKILLFALPLFIGSLFQQLYNTADSLIVGNLVSASALAAVSSTGSLIYLLIGFFMGFSSGAGIVVARNIGAQDRENTSKAVHTAVAMGLFFSVLLTVTGVLGSPYLLRWMGTPADVFDQAELYLKIYFGGSFALVMYNTFVGILQASGDSRHPLYYLIASSILNIILDVLFIAVFRMGVGGAALATVISEFFSMGLSLIRLTGTDDLIRLEFTKIRFHGEHLQQILRYGFPTALQACVIDLSNILIQSYINSFGSQAMAGLGAYSKVDGFSFLPVTAFSLSLSTYVSQNLGAGKKDRMRQGVRFGLVCAIVMIETIGLLFFAFAPRIIGMFNPDPAVIAYGVNKARVCAPFFFLLGFSHVTSAVMRGVGKPMAPMIVMLVCWCAVRVLVFMTVGAVFHDIRLTYWIYPFTWFLSSISYLWYMRKLRAQDIL